MSSSARTAPAATPSLRLTSLDQFRGYTMLGMLLVNYLGGYKLVCPRILRHTHDYCSYADTIMPHFLFAAGFAMQLSLGKRLESGKGMPWGRAIRRILGLALVAIAWYTYCDYNSIVNNFKTQPTNYVLLKLFKGDFCQTLMHIAYTSLWILPVIPASWKVRLGYAVFSGVLHVLVSWWFNFVWVHSDPGGVDGGPLGFLTWAIPALCGTLACDAVRYSGVLATRRIAFCGVGVMILGWVLSIPSTMYNVHDEAAPELGAPASVATPAEPATASPATTEAPSAQDATPAADTPGDAGAKPPADAPAGAAADTPAEPADDPASVNPPAQQEPVQTPSEQPTRPAEPATPPKWVPKPLDPVRFPSDPVMPSKERFQAWDKSIIEPPFVPPPDYKHRQWNYWMMSQRGGNLSYPTFAAGLSLVVYALFLWVCDGKKRQLGLFRTLGTNSLAAYILHDVAAELVFPKFPKTSDDAVFVMMGFVVFTVFVYSICRFLEWMGWYIRV